MRRYAKETLSYIVVFCLGYLVACQGGSTGTSANPTGAVRQMVTSDRRPVALVQSSTNLHPALAAVLFGTRSVRPNATIANPSPVGQSYESDCSNFSSSGVTWGGIHAAFGNSGLVSIRYAYGQSGSCLTQAINSVGDDESGTPQGYPIILDGTINTLAVYGTFVSGNRFRCVDTTNSSPLSDGSFARAYYDLSHDAVILGSGTTQLSPTCSISIPSGDDVLEIHVQWLKS